MKFSVGDITGILKSHRVKGEYPIYEILSIQDGNYTVRRFEDKEIFTTPISKVDAGAFLIEKAESHNLTKIFA